MNLAHELVNTALNTRGKDNLVQLAKDFNKFPLHYHKNGALFPGYMSEKFDGVYCLIPVVDGHVGFFSRTGEQFFSLYSDAAILEARELHVRSWCNFVLIAEVYVPDTPQSKISGACRKESMGFFENAEFRVHDVLAVDEFLTGKAIIGYEARLRWLDVLFSDTERKQIKKVEQTLCIDAEHFQKFAAGVQKRGGEGAVLRSHVAGWVAGNRGPNLVRIKQEITHDLEVIDMEEGKGKYAGTLGTLVLRWKDGASIRVSGMTDEQRRLWWKNPELIIGKVVEVKAMRYSTDGLLREPRFKGVRYDKGTADF